MGTKSEHYDPLPDEFWVVPTSSDVLQYSYTGTYLTLEMGVGDNCTFGFRLPDDFTKLIWAKLVMLPDANEKTVRASFVISACAAGEKWYNNTSVFLSQTLAVMDDKLVEWEIKSFFPARAAGDYVGIRVGSETNKLRIIGLAIKYS